jgi:hypothetical protein
MLLLPFVTRCIAELDEWPSDILRLLFCDDCKVTHIRDVCAFLYGNGLPLIFATKLYLYVNDDSDHLTANTIRTFYTLWHDDAESTHHAKYYNVRQKQLLWINGSNHPQYDPVVQYVTEIDLGIDMTLHPEHIRQTVEDISNFDVQLDMLM